DAFVDEATGADVGVRRRAWEHTADGGRVYFVPSRSFTAGAVATTTAAAAGGVAATAATSDSAPTWRDRQRRSSRRGVSGGGSNRPNAGVGITTPLRNTGRFDSSAERSSIRRNPGAGSTAVSAGEGSKRAEPPSQRWREITEEPFELLLLVDAGLGHARALLAAPEPTAGEAAARREAGRRPAGLYIQPSLAEYCMLLSVYFDNYCELPSFFGALGPGYWGPATPPDPTWPPYGTAAMLQRVLRRPPSWEFAVSLPVLEAACAIDTRYFPAGA
ncbi:unnamed protein product, partial [Phaeothamnion confervicola]